MNNSSVKRRQSSCVGSYEVCTVHAVLPHGAHKNMPSHHTTESVPSQPLHAVQMAPGPLLRDDVFLCLSCNQESHLMISYFSVS